MDIDIDANLTSMLFEKNLFSKNIITHNKIKYKKLIFKLNIWINNLGNKIFKNRHLTLIMPKGVFF